MGSYSSAQGGNHATHGCGNHDPLPPGRRRRIRLRLSGRRGAQHLRRAFQTGKVKHVLVRHEQGAVHAADGYSRSSHKVGVALVTSGPGVTNAVTGIATAYMDSIPMVVITGQSADACDRPGRVPGVRHRRHHAAVRQAQLPRQGREGPGRHDQEGVLSGVDRTSWPRARRHSEGRHAGGDRVQLSEDDIAPLGTTR